MEVNNEDDEEDDDDLIDETEKFIEGQSGEAVNNSNAYLFEDDPKKARRI